MEERLRERVRYHETDAGGGAGERVFIYWFDAARAACLRKQPAVIDLLRSGEIAIKTEELFYNIKGKRFPVYDEEVEVTVRYSLREDGSMKYEYDIKSPKDGTCIASGYSVHNFYKDGTKLERDTFFEMLKAREI